MLNIRQIYDIRKPESETLTSISGADKWPITVCSVQIFNKGFFGPTFLHCVHNSVVLVEQDLIFFFLP